jgi:hypothetical protein
LIDGWMGEPAQIHIYQQTQVAASEFRAFCLENNLLDYSLQIDVFLKHVWRSPLVRKYLTEYFHHLIYENLEEDVPVAHDFIHEWLQDFDSSLLIFDENGGYRTFLGADPKTAFTLKSLCDDRLEFRESFTLPAGLAKLDKTLPAIIRKEETPNLDQVIRNSFEVINFRFTTDMVNGVAESIQNLIKMEDIAPSEIVVISPFMSDVLKFTLQARFDSLEIPNHTIRLSRSIESEPAARSLVTFAKIAHPDWSMIPSIFELRSAFLQTIANGDLNRADLLARIVNPTRKNAGGLGRFNTILPDMQTRITYSIGKRFEILRAWMENYTAGDPADLDVFFRRIFGEVLSQASFGFHDDFESARIASQLIASVQKFRRLVAGIPLPQSTYLGKEYIQMVESGVLTAQFYDPDELNFGNNVLLSPAYSYLMMNRLVAYQFWLDVGRLSWWERVNQPLTQPFVLSREWNTGRKWTDADEYSSNQHMMARLVSGLIRRSRRKIYFCTIGLNEYGLEEKGPLMQSLQILMKRLSAQEQVHV